MSSQCSTTGVTKVVVCDILSVGCMCVCLTKCMYVYMSVCMSLSLSLSLSLEARCSSVVRAFAHGAMGRRIDPSWWTH